MYRRGIATAALGLALAMGLSGCFNGYQAQTSTQSEGGEVASANVGDIQLRGLIWVVPADEAAKEVAEGAEGAPASEQTASEAYLSGTMVLTTDGEPDTLVSIEVPEGTVTLGGEPVELTPNVPAAVGFNGTSFASLTGGDIPGSGFITTTFNFENAGEVSVDILTVPGVGVYADVVEQSRAAAPAAEGASPEGATSPAGETAEPAASPAAS